MKKIAVIPARGGSKRIPRKNIKSFLGAPIITYVINAAIQSELFDEVIVSTDDPEIADIAINAGATVPFTRSENTSSDVAALADVITEVDDYLLNKDVQVDQICCILATAVLTSSAQLVASNNYFDKNNFDVVMPIVRYGYPIQRALKKDQDTKIHMIDPLKSMYRSQDLNPTFHDAGQYYWLNMDAFRSKKVFFGENTSGLEVPETLVQDIDTDTDWKIAELKYKMAYGN